MERDIARGERERGGEIGEGELSNCNRMRNKKRMLSSELLSTVGMCIGNRYRTADEL